MSSFVGCRQDVLVQMRACQALRVFHEGQSAGRVQARLQQGTILRLLDVRNPDAKPDHLPVF